jgi:multidrug efflux pump subunit AcrA (membrane-fusion protein)/predicted Ser/Thr protein kinase
LEEVAKLFPQLEILGFIGKGGMGAVYKARQPALDRLVALKILPPQAAGGAGFAERFNREARALAKLNHPNIVAVHEFGQAGGSPFFIMEFVDGLTLRQLEQAGRLSPGEALRIVPQICEALQFAHDEGIVHRDIKPENILIDKKGRVKIADFGIAKIIGGGEGWSGMTGTRQAIGTPHYMAPEQVEKPQTVDHRADIFSLGVVFYEMLTGQLPLGRFAPPSRKVEIDARLDEVVLRALEREPELRYQQAGAVKTEIDTITSTPASNPSGEHASRPAGTSQPAPSPAGSINRPGQVFAWLALGFLIVGLLGCPFLIAIRANDHAALAFGGMSVLLALIFGMVSWHHSVGRVLVKVMLLGLGLLVVAGGGAILWAQHRAAQARAEADAEQLSRVEEVYNYLGRNLRKKLMDLQNTVAPLESNNQGNNDMEIKRSEMERDIEILQSELKHLEEANPGLRALEAAKSTIHGLTNRTMASTLPPNNPTGQGRAGHGEPTRATATRGSIGRYLSCPGSVKSSNSLVYVAFDIPVPAAEEVIKKLSSALPVEAFDQDNNKLGHGLFGAVAREVDSATGTVKGLASLQPEPGRVVLINQFVFVRLLLEMKHDAVLVPAAALIHDNPDHVLVINPDHSITRRDVVVGIMDGTNTEIQSGLQPGETVVGDNAQKFEETRNGTNITVQTNPSPPLFYQWYIEGTNVTIVKTNLTGNEAAHQERQLLDSNDMIQLGTMMAQKKRAQELNLIHIEAAEAEKKRLEDASRRAKAEAQLKSSGFTNATGTNSTVKTNR